MIAVTNQIGHVYHLIRDAAGRVVAEEDFDGRRTEYTRDPAGRVTQTRKPDGSQLTYSYDRSDRLTAIHTHAADDPEGARPRDETHLRYDGRGLLIEASSRAARVVLERDGNGRIVSETTNGRRVESRLDGLGRRIERRIGAGQPGASLVRIGRDPLGALASLAIDDHAPLMVSRDPLGRETRRSSAAGFVLEQAFDPVGQLMRQRAGREGQAGRAYAWDKAGAPTLIDDALFGPARYRYDGNGQMAQASFGDSLTERFDYDAAKNVVGVLAEGTEAGEILGALRRVEATPGGAVRVGHGPHGERVALTHDACGRVIERRVERRGFRPRTWRYGWDIQDRLVRCETPEGEVWHYRYDAFGRRLSKVREFTQTERAWVSRRYPEVVPEALRPETVLWTWPEPPKSHALHDPRPPIVGTQFLWDGDVVAEEALLRLGGSVDWEVATRWHYEPESFVPVAKQAADGSLRYIVTDHLGTPREMFDEAGRLRWAVSLTTWGVVRRVAVPSAPDNDAGRVALYPRGRVDGSVALRGEPDAGAYECPIRFQGQWADKETGLYYNRHRHYDEISSQYSSLDPLGLKGGGRLSAYVVAPTILVDFFALSASTIKLDPALLNRTHPISGTKSSKTVAHFVDQFKSEGEFAGDPLIAIKHQGKYYVVDGHHRLKAAKIAGVDAKVRFVEPSTIFSEGGFRDIQDILNSAATAGPDNIRGPRGIRW